MLVLALSAPACSGDGDGVGSPFSGDESRDTGTGLDIEDLASGELDPARLENAEELIEQLDLGSGGGRVTVADVTYEFEAEVCFALDGDFSVEGPAVGSDGSTAWVSIGYTLDTRDELEQVLDDETVDSVLGEADQLEDALVQVEVGREELLGAAPAGLPHWDVSSAYTVAGTEIDWTLDGSSMRGGGAIADINTVALDFGEAVPFTFEASCG